MQCDHSGKVSLLSAILSTVALHTNVAPLETRHRYHESGVRRWARARSANGPLPSGKRPTIFGLGVVGGSRRALLPTVWRLVNPQARLDVHQSLVGVFEVSSLTRRQQLRDLAHRQLGDIDHEIHPFEVTQVRQLGGT